MSDAEVVHQVTCHRVAFGHLHPECVGILGRGKHLSPGAVRSKQGGQLVRNYFKAQTTAVNQVQTSSCALLGGTITYISIRRDVRCYYCAAMYCGGRAGAQGSPLLRHAAQLQGVHVPRGGTTYRESCDEECIAHGVSS